MGQDVAGTPKLNGTNYLGVLLLRVFWQSASAARKVTSLFLGHYCPKVLVKRFRRQMKRVAGSEDKEKAVLDMNMCLSLFTTSVSPGVQSLSCPPSHLQQPGAGRVSPRRLRILRNTIP